MQRYSVPEKKTVQELEAEVLEYWNKNSIFKKSVEQRPAENLYVFYDGPPFISGLPHYGHLLGSIAKDVIPRYWTMKGKRVERVWGWDAHGLTVENKVQKKLGIKDRKDIVSYGLEKFTEECYTYTSETSAEWNWYIDKIGRWVDMENAYKTIDQDYMESVMWVFKELYDKGLIYEGVRTSLYCTTCGTPVSNFEVAMDNTYKEVEDPSVIAKFKVLTEGDFADKFILAWTTTPWTLPSNRALVVDKDADYVLVTVDGDELILAKQRLEPVLGDNVAFEKTFKGSELVGLRYEPLYDFYTPLEKEFMVYHYGDMVNMEEGTGIVHSAPGFGEIDTQMGMEFGLTIMLKLDDEGKFMPADNGVNPFEGQYYADANPKITKDLQGRGLLFREETIVHRFPFHDRCDTPLIQKAQNSWFINVQDLKEDLYKHNEQINWIPEHLKEGRFKKGIEQAPDWCISRSRFWATPMPVWRSEDGDVVVVGSIAELEELSGQKVKDLHRPYIDEVTIEKDGKVYKRIEDVLDSWFEAGAMPYAQIHYPFENQEKFEKNFPGDYIVEYIAQVRAWFYVMHVLSVALKGTNSFKNVISTGVMGGTDGRKMSKTYGNYTDPKEIIENFGGDAIRLYLMNSPLMVGGNTNLDEPEIKTKLNKVLNPLLNSMRFFLIYASKYEWSPEKLEESKNVLDQWILIRLHETIKAFAENIEQYKVPNAVQPVEDFVDDLSRWYVRRSRERLSKGDNSALSTLYTVLEAFSRCIAPITPFIAETIYKEVSQGNDESVHLAKFPSWDEKIIDEGRALVEKMAKTREVISLALSIRDTESIKVRQPLQTVYVYDYKEEPAIFADLVVDEVNVKGVEMSQPKDGNPRVESAFFSVALDNELSDELLLEGQMRDFVRKVQDMRKKAKLDVTQQITLVYPEDDITNKIMSKYEDFLREKVQANFFEKGDELAIKND